MEKANNGLVLESASVRVNNSGMENREYEITASVKHNGKEVIEIESGSISKNGKSVASFNSYGDGNCNFTFYVPAAEQPAALEAINAFIAEAKDFAVAKANL